MSWYYIDASGTTLGPVEEGVIVSKFKGKELNDDSYVWNGTTVNEWSLIKNVGFLKAKCKPAPPAQSRPAPARGGRGAAPRPAAGGGKPKAKKAPAARMNLLDSIRSGKQLKKVEKKPEPAASSGSRMGGRPGGKMSLQDQLKMKLNKRSTGPVKKSTGGSVGGGSKPTPAWKKKSTTGSSNTSSGPKKTWGNKSSSSAGSSNKSSGGGKMSKFEIKKAIDGCNDDWILKAISKLLS